MKFPKTIREVMNKHKSMPKEFSAKVGMNYGTVKNAHAGKKSPVVDQFALIVDYALEHGFDAREIGL